MKFSRATSALDADTNASPSRRGLGPFSGGQLTVIILAIVVMVMLPVGAWAVAGSNVFVTDAVSGKQASVNTSGQLATSQNAASVVIQSGTTTVNPNSNAFLFLGVNVSAYSDVRFVVSAAGPVANHEAVQLLTKAGTILATLDQWTLATNIETRRYDLPGLALSAVEFNFDANVPATVSWTLVGRPN